MEFGSTAILLTVLSVLMGFVFVLVLIHLIPLIIQSQKAHMKRKEVQKKVNEEMIKNVRYRPSSQPSSLKGHDYGSTLPRESDTSIDFQSRSVDLEKIGLPSFNVTCEEESLTEEHSQTNDIFTDKNDLQNRKRRFSSIIFTHSDEIKILTDEDSLDVNDKRERRASMSLFETCKLACPELSDDLGTSTEHLNQTIHSNNENQGKLYFMLSQQEANKKGLEIVVIKVTNIAERKNKDYQIEMNLIESENDVIYKHESSIRVCSGEVVNFDEAFTIEVDDKTVSGEDKCLTLVFTLINHDSKKTGKSNRLGEIRFDLMELFEGRIFRFDGHDEFVICRNFVNLTNKIKFNDSTGKILIFLRFLNVSPLNLVIGLVELKNLTSNKHFSCVNVRISLATGGKVLESKKSKIVKKKNQNDDGTLRLDESFEFNLSHNKLFMKESTKVANISSDQNLFITLFICGRNNIGFSHVLGKCVLGPIEFADGTGLFHWNKGVSHLAEIIHHWHSLKN